MAAYQGARRRPALSAHLDQLVGGAAALDRWLPWVAPVRDSASTRRASRAAAGRSVRALGRGRSWISLALIAIVFLFSGGFLSLSQTVRVAATGYDIVRLASEQDRLTAIDQDLRSQVDRLRSEPAIRKEALDAGLGQLGAPIIIPAR
jgi:hypothetical protein